MSRKKKKNPLPAAVELNVMPFIDVFSLLCTFLLFSAVFISIGIHTVSTPFLSNSSSAKKDKNKEKRSIQLNISLESNRIEVRTSWSLPPESKKIESFSNSDVGIESFHKRILQLKRENTKLDTATVFIDDNITYKNISTVLDNLTLVFDSDKDFMSGSTVFKNLIPKVIFGSVVL